MVVNKKMQIKLNETESYNIQIAEEYSAIEFSQLIKRLNEIQDLIKTPIITPTDNEDLICIFCGSEKVGLDGLSNDKKFQRYTCKTCKRRFSHGHLTGEIKLAKAKTSYSTKDKYAKKGSAKKGYIKKGYTKKNGAKVFSNERRPMVVFWNSRDEVIELLKTHYYGSKSEKLRFADKKKTSWENCLKATSNLRKRFNVKPSEVGIKSFPTRAGRKQKAVKV